MFKNIFSRKNFKNTEMKSFGIPNGSFLSQVFLGGRITPAKSSEFYRESSAVATAVDVIAKEIENIQPVVMLKDGKLTEDHPVIDLLKNPNEFEDYREFIGRLSRHYLLNHDAYIYGEGSVRRMPINIFASTNQHVSISQNNNDRYPDVISLTTGFGEGSYTRNKVNNKIRFYDGNLKEIYQIHGFSSRSDNIFADSPLEAAALETRQQILGTNHNLKIIENGGRLSLAVIFRDEIKPDEWESRKNKIMEQFSGSENAGAIAMFSSPDMEIEEMGQTNKDMDFSTLNKMSKEAIFARYGVPLPLVSSDRQTFNNFDRAIEDLYDRSVLPYANVLFSGLTKFLKGRSKDDFIKITFNPEEITALKKRQLDELKIRKEVNIETVNELRQRIPGREPLEGGDIYYQSATLIPVGEDFLTDDDPIETVNPQDAIADEAT